MAWQDVKVTINGKTMDAQKRSSNDEFVLNVSTKIKAGDKITCDKENYEVLSVENSRDEFLLVSASADEKKTQPEGNIEDDGEKPQSI